ncbi:hypothetical protein [Aliagarivorans taiwanensis]|uniref:hypothetical protein n=1 Tax=Aliagarivorans taiwanensis TaxID=561966 RepID=UPI00041947E0|nr:hypothetical protein [Aliagarivorans taiwanensis]
MLNRSLIHDIQQALRSNLIPGILLQLFALMLALSYFHWPAAQLAFDQLASLKAQYQWRFSAVATALFGGLIPFAIAYWSGQVSGRIWPQILCLGLLWAYKGVEVDLVYQWQARVFGEGADWQTVATKVAVDQFIYAALWSIPGIALVYHWKDRGFVFRGMGRELNRRFWQQKVLSMVLTNWLIWIPAVAIVYTMPLNLQIPLFNIVLCFFSLLVAMLSKPPVEAASLTN